MSKRSKALSKKKNLDKKRAIKAANKAKYQAWKDAGKNTKSIRARRNSKKKLIKTKDHKDGNCGNIGCMKCVPRKTVITF